MSSAEFIATSPLRLRDQPGEGKEGAVVDEATQSLMQFTVHFDPYSATAASDYETLRSELEKFDILRLLQSELAKSRIHISLSKKIVSAIRYLQPHHRESAVLSLIDNAELLYPVFANVLMVVKQVFDDLTEDARGKVVAALLQMHKTGSHVLKVELILAYTLRVLALYPSPAVQEFMARTYNNQAYGPLVRRDVILGMARLGTWPWLSDVRSAFRSMTPSERRSFIVASFVLKDEGSYWRKHMKEEFSPLERLVSEWAAKKVQQNGWVIPI